MKQKSETPPSDVSDEERAAALVTMSVQARKMLEPLDRLEGLEALACGAREPRTPAQVHFVKLVGGQTSADWGLQASISEV